VLLHICIPPNSDLRGTHPFITSLSASAFGIYLLHYPAVTWLQFGLLNQPLSAPLKATLVFLGALALSWALTAAGSAILRPRRSP
jgi:surface polysaccharide O-acyltransferase-like enzyme